MNDNENRTILVLNTVSSIKIDQFLINLKRFLQYKDSNNIVILHLNGSKKIIKELIFILRYYTTLSFSKKKNNVTIAGLFDDNITRLSLFFLLGSVALFAFSGFSCLIVGKNLNVRKLHLSFPFKPLTILLNIPKILSSYCECYFKNPHGKVLGFNKMHSPMNMWYKTLGQRQLKYGAWGYNYEEDFGASNRNQFAMQWLSYGLLQNILGHKWFSFVSALLFLSSIIFSGFYVNNFGIGIMLVLLVVFSPYFWASFITYTRPQCIVWFLALPAFISVIYGNTLILAFILFLISYLTFTGTFFIGLGVLSLILTQDKLYMIVACIPVIVKLIIDLFPLLQPGKSEIIDRFRGKGDSRATKYIKKRRLFGILLNPNHILVGFNLFVLLTFSYFKSNPLFPVISLFFLLLIVQFYFIRLADLDTFYRLCLISCVSVAMFGNSIAEILIPMFLLYIIPKWVNDFKIPDAFTQGKQFYPDSPVVLQKKKKRDIEEILNKIQTGNRVLFQYSGQISQSDYRYVNLILHNILNENRINILPSWNTAYTNPRWFFEDSTLLDDRQDVDKCIEMLKNCGFEYVIIYSESLVKKLIKKSFQNVATIPDTFFNDISPCLLKKDTVLYILRCPFTVSIIQPNDINLERCPNNITVHDPEPGQKIILKYTYDKVWKAKQGNNKIPIYPYAIHGLEFMHLTAINKEPIKLKFGRLNYFIR